MVRGLLDGYAGEGCLSTFLFVYRTPYGPSDCQCSPVFWWEAALAMLILPTVLYFVLSINSVRTTAKSYTIAHYYPVGEGAVDTCLYSTENSVNVLRCTNEQRQTVKMSQKAHNLASPDRFLTQYGAAVQRSDYSVVSKTAWLRSIRDIFVCRNEIDARISRKRL